MTICKCDKCGKEIPIIKKKNMLGTYVNVVDVGYVRCAEWNIDRLFDGIDLCKPCAELISIQCDNVFLRIKLAEANEN